MAFSVTDGQGSNVLAAAAAMIALCTIAVGLRIWGRFIGHKTRLWWDDWLSLAALVRSPPIPSPRLVSCAGGLVLITWDHFAAMRLDHLRLDYILGLSRSRAAHHPRTHRIHHVRAGLPRR